jgi:hypothetical protein
MLLVCFVLDHMATVKSGEMLTKEEQQKEADVMTLTTTEVMQSIKLICFDANGNPQSAAAM